MVDGGKDPLTFVIPPPGFNPLTATTAELVEYNFPPRPTDPTQLTLWNSTMANATPAPLPSELMQSAAKSLSFAIGGGWAGYYDASSSYTETVGYYVEPTLYSSACTSPQLGVWDGLGGTGTDSQLAQVGTGDVPNHSHQAFLEELPNGPVWLSVYGVIGGVNATYVQYVGQYNGISYVKYFVKNSSGNYVNPEYAYGTFTSGTADFEFEAPQTGSGPAPLANFETDSFTYAGTELGGFSGQTVDTDYIPSVNNPYPFPSNPTPSSTSAYPNSISSNAFSVAQYNCHVNGNA